MNFENESMAASDGSELIPVLFEFTNTTAGSVCVAGTFNHWNPGEAPMTMGYGDHCFKKASLPPGRYEYRLVVDGEWGLDPANQCSVSNNAGSRNSVFTLAHSAEKIHRTNAMKTLFQNSNGPHQRAVEKRAQLICDEMTLAEGDQAWDQLIAANAARNISP